MRLCHRDGRAATLAKNCGRVKEVVGFAKSAGYRHGGRMKKPALGLILFASLLLTGCPVSTLHPLYNNDNVAEPLLVGNWILPDTEDKGVIAFEKSSGSGYTMVLTDPDTGYTDRYDVQLVRLGENLFGDLKFASRSKSGTNMDMPFSLVSAHMIIKLKVSKDTLDWSTMEDDAMKNLVKTDAAPGKPAVGNLQYDSDNSLVLADTDTLRRYVTAHGTDGFSEAEHLKRGN